MVSPLRGAKAGTRKPVLLGLNDVRRYKKTKFSQIIDSEREISPLEVAIVQRRRLKEPPWSLQLDGTSDEALHCLAVGNW